MDIKQFSNSNLQLAKNFQIAIYNAFFNCSSLFVNISQFANRELLICVQRSGR